MKKAILAFLGMKRKASQRGGGFVFLGVTLPVSIALGCDAQVGQGYTGEPLLSLRGSVVLTNQRDEDLVPVISFGTGSTRALIDGEVQGEFPAAFRFDVTEPPPDAALEDFSPMPRTRLKGRVAIGSIVVLPREHPRLFPNLSLEQSFDVCNPVTQTCTWTEERCASDGRCIKRVLSCTDEPCPLLASSGDPSIRGEFPPGTSFIGCITESCLTAQQWNDEENQFYREFRSCDLSRSDENTTFWSVGKYRVCELISESGDPSLTNSVQFEGGVLGYGIYYVLEENPIPGFGTFKPGYNVLQVIQPPDDAWMAQLNCQYDAAIAAVVGYNQAHGTSYVLHRDVDDPVAEKAISDESQRLRSECPEALAARLVEDPLAHPLTMKVGRGAIPGRL